MNFKNNLIHNETLMQSHKETKVFQILLWKFFQMDFDRFPVFWGKSKKSEYI